MIDFAGLIEYDNHIVMGSGTEKRFCMDNSAETAKSNYSDGIRVRQGICTICFVLLCLIDQIVGSAMPSIQEVAISCIGLIIAAIILTGRYRWKDFLQMHYAVWIILCGIAYVCLIRFREEYRYSTSRWVLTLTVINAAIYGCLVLRILIRIFLEKKVPRMNWGFYILWVVMMLGMVFSRNDDTWPFWFLVIFGCFYLTEYSAEEMEALFTGMLNGIIIGFCILQGFATMFRAHDEMRYTGMYTNSNMNALFYLMVHAAILGKWYQFKRKDAALRWRLLAAVGSGVLIAYGFLTICRTAVMTMLVNTTLLTVLLFFEERAQEMKRRILKAAGRVTTALLAAVVLFPAVFFSVRWIPAEFYSAMKLAWDSEGKIQGWAPLNDERYVEMNQFLEYAPKRLFWFFDFEKKEESRTGVSGTSNVASRIMDFLSPPLKVRAAEDTQELGTPEKTAWGSGLTAEDPVLTDPKDIVNPAKVRLGIYWGYLGRLNFVGHRSEEDGVWLTAGNFAPHAHNFLLQMMFSHGILTGILFMMVLLYTFLHCLMQCLRKKRGSWFFILGVFMIVSFVGFGLLEIDWGTGQLSFISIFVVPYLLFHKYGRERSNMEQAEPAAKMNPVYREKTDHGFLRGRTIDWKSLFQRIKK